jgi:hypothetical protein
MQKIDHKHDFCSFQLFVESTTIPPTLISWNGLALAHYEVINKCDPQAYVSLISVKPIMAGRFYGA